MKRVDLYVRSDMGRFGQIVSPRATQKHRDDDASSMRAISVRAEHARTDVVRGLIRSGIGLWRRFIPHVLINQPTPTSSGSRIIV